MFRHVGMGCALALGILTAAPNVGAAQPFAVLPSREEAIVQNATSVLDQVMAAPGRAIPRHLLADAQGVAIIPGMLRGGFVIGARHGEGVLLIRGADGAWQAPVFITITGGNIGWQIGIQSSDLILVFRTQRSVQGLLNGQFTLGVDAAAAAGPVGRDVAVATDARLQAEIYSYSRTRGLFAGVALDGSVLRINQAANAAFYQPFGPAQPAVVPQSAATLVAHVAAYSGGGELPVAQMVAAQPAPLPAGVQPLAIGQVDAVRNQLLASMGPLMQGLPADWTAFLTLPQAEAGQEVPLAAWQRTLDSYAKVAADPQYQALTRRPEFQTTYQLLQQYVALQRQAEQPLNLPPPPVGGQPGAVVPPAAEGVPAAAPNLLQQNMIGQPAASGPWRPVGEPSPGFSTLPQ